MSNLSLSRVVSADSERGRSRQAIEQKPRSVSATSREDGDDSDSTAVSRTRSMSPFRRRRKRARDPSPVEALSLSQSDVESDTEGRKPIRPRSSAFNQNVTSDDESANDDEDDNDSEESWSDGEMFDSITNENTEQNSLVPARPEENLNEAPDPLGEGVNIVVPPEPYFPTTLNNTHRNPRRKRSTRHTALSITTSRPVFQRDRCTITLVQGDPAFALEQNGRRSRRYVVASDLSEESRYAVEWGIGTVLRDGDEM